MNNLTAATLLGFTLLLGLTASAGTLRIGTPTIENDQYTFPILLESRGDVAALNFRLEFDPAVFQAAAAQTGTAAQAAQKSVSGHAPHDGAYNVVLMGFNQTAMAGGEVARITLSRIGGEEGARVSLTGQTLAAPNGDEVPSQGDSAVVAFDPPDIGETPDGEAPAEDEPDAEAPADEPADDEADAPDAEGRPGQTGNGDGLAGFGGLDQSGAEVLAGAAPADEQGRLLRQRDRREAQMRVEDAIAQERSGGGAADGESQPARLPGQMPAPGAEPGDVARNDAPVQPDGTPQAKAVAAITVEAADEAQRQALADDVRTADAGRGTQEGLADSSRWWPIGLAALAASVVLALVGWRLYG